MMLFCHVPKFNPFEFACMTLCLLKTFIIINSDSFKRYEMMHSTIEARKNNCRVGSNALIYLPDAHFFTFSPSNILLKVYSSLDGMFELDVYFLYAVKRFTKQIFVIIFY